MSPLILRLTDTAEADLAEIWSFVASESSEATATRLLAKIENTSRLLLEFPLSGTARNQFAAGLRVILEGNYAIYYTVSEAELVIVRVLHGARDTATLARRGGFM
ncbi:MAG: type II toxin-antitoxin system RelE/ParE family toxin [Magnetococcales bacterium]|nr:type II toxin-antitoxin system RelE/ParE family toxin [Magnetococcales bacterium]